MKILEKGCNAICLGAGVSKYVELFIVSLMSDGEVVSIDVKLW